MDDLEQFKSQGYLVLKNVLSESECATYKTLLNEACERYTHLHIDRVGAEHGLADKCQEKIVHNLHNKDFSFIQLIDHPAVYPILASVLQAGSYKEQEPFIHQKSAGRSPSQGSLQQLHIDSRFPGSPFALTAQVMWVLDPFNEETGATRVVPGSHLRQAFPENGVEYEDELSLEAEPGDVLIFNGSLWHGSGLKKSADDRWAMIFSYARWYVKAAFDFNKNMPRKYFDQLTDQQKSIFGYYFNPSPSEFERVSARSQTIQEPEIDYQLPN